MYVVHHVAHKHGVMLTYDECHLFYCYDECQYAEYHYVVFNYAVYHYAECHYADCCGTINYTVLPSLSGANKQ
jgi:hypothetical protein